LGHRALHVGAVGVGERPHIVVVGSAEHGQLFDGGGSLLLGRGGGGAQFIESVDEVAAGAVGAEADAVVGSAHVGLVFGMTVDGPQLVGAVSKLTFFSVLAYTVFLVGAAHLCLVARAVLGVGGGALRRCLKTGARREAGQRLLAISWQKRFSGRIRRSKSRLARLVLIVVSVNTNPQTLETVLLDLSNHFHK